ncbi:22145_t:CDS:2, partial [Gigaspora margarita]
NEKEFINTLTKQKCPVLERDRIVAEYLGITHPEIVWLIRRLSEKVEWLKLKIGRNKSGTQEILEKKKSKEVLLLTECGVSNYGTKEVQKQLTENKVAELAKYNNLTKSIIKNQNKEVEMASTSHSPSKKPKIEDINSSIWVLLAKNMIVLISSNLKDIVTKAEIEKMETVTGNNHNLVLVQLRTNSFFRRTKEVSVVKKLAARHVWNLSKAMLENWENYRASL